MDKFVVEEFKEGEFLCVEEVESNQRLLNEQDLDVICYGKDTRVLFVRRHIDINNGYYLAGDNRWEYGTSDDAAKTIKQRIK